MSILIWIIFGAVVGWLASVVMKGSGIGLIGNIVVGILGSFLGGFIASFLGFGTIQGFDLKSLIIAFLGSCLLLFIVSKIKK